jgi:hypothetical protein
MIEKWKNLIYGEEHPLQARLFVLIISVSAVCLLLTVINDILTGATLRELLVLMAMLLVLAFIAIYMA